LGLEAGTTFDASIFDQQVADVENATIAQLMVLDEQLAGMHVGLIESFTQNIEQLSAKLPEDLRIEIGDKLAQTLEQQTIWREAELAHNAELRAMDIEKSQTWRETDIATEQLQYDSGLLNDQLLNDAMITNNTGNTLILSNSLNSINNTLNTGFSSVTNGLSSIQGAVSSAMAAKKAAEEKAIFSVPVEDTELPSFASGSYEVPKDMAARIHAGEMIIPRAPAEAIRNGNTGNTSGGNDEVEGLLRELVGIMKNKDEKIVAAVNRLSDTVTKPIVRAVKKKDTRALL